MITDRLGMRTTTTQLEQMLAALPAETRKQYPELITLVRDTLAQEKENRRRIRRLQNRLIKLDRRGDRVVWQAKNIPAVLPRHKTGSDPPDGLARYQPSNEGGNDYIQVYLNGRWRNAILVS